MFKEHQRQISDRALETDQGTIELFAFVFCTIQQRFDRMEQQMQDVRANGLDAKSLFGSKRKGLEYVFDNVQHLRTILRRCKEGVTCPIETLSEIAEVPGLGLVKAGFVMQLATGHIGCLDTHNLNRFGLDAQAFKYSKTATSTLKKRKAKLYADMCQQCGGSEYLWDSWCELVAAKYPAIWNDAFHVSAYHNACLFTLGRL